jgi:hypothetical protein
MAIRSEPALLGIIRQVTSLAELIFPSGDPRDGYILRLDLVDSWESQFLGLGRLTAFVTPRLLAEAHAVDDMGINVVFLQRHRVEVGLKLILERAQAKPVGEHKVAALWKRCDQACAAAGFPSQWQSFADAQEEYAKLLGSVDPEAATFRYPVDMRNQPWKRGHVDLAELERAGAAFERDAVALVREIAAEEALPVTAEDSAEAAKELRLLIAGCRSVMGVSRQIAEEFRRQADGLSSLMPTVRKTRRDIGSDGFPELAAVAEVTEPLADRAQNLLDRIVDAYGIELPPGPPSRSVKPAPVLNPLSPPEAIKATQDAQIRWVGNLLAEEFRGLTQAVNAVYRRTQDWSTPAARQIHLDVTRFRSRLTTTAAQRAET